MKLQKWERERRGNMESRLSQKGISIEYISDSGLAEGLKKDWLAPEDFENLFDFYVVSRRFNWTYAVTHESELGPYYYHKKMESNVEKAEGGIRTL